MLTRGTKIGSLNATPKLKTWNKNKKAVSSGNSIDGDGMDIDNARSVS